MEEIAGVVIVLLAFVYVPALAHAIGRNWAICCYAGCVMTLVSLVVSLVAGARYHLALYRALGPRGLLPKAWIWAPTRHHHKLLPEDRPGVLSWFYVGALAFVCALVGCALVAWAAAYGLHDELAWERIAS